MRPRERPRALQGTADAAGEANARPIGAEEPGAAENAPNRRRAMPAADVPQDLPVLDPVADLLQARARDRSLRSGIEKDELAAGSDLLERARSHPVARRPLAVEHPAD